MSRIAWDDIPLEILHALHELFESAQRVRLIRCRYGLFFAGRTGLTNDLHFYLVNKSRAILSVPLVCHMRAVPKACKTFIAMSCKSCSQ